MGLKELVEIVTDPYERQARLWPALLTLFPLILTLGLLYGDKLTALTNVVLLVGSCGGLFLLTNISRELGTRLEPKLFKAWGGKPTTQLLRHHNTIVDSITKRRYHGFLAKLINESFPDQGQEASNPQVADDMYESAVLCLIEKTREKQKFNLLFLENISYGFRRNGLALKPIGITISVVCIVWVLLANGVIAMSGQHIFDKSALINLSETAISSAVASLIMLLVWILFFTKTSTRTAAFTYAKALLKACDVL